MNSEGRGTVAPSPVRVHLTRHELQVLASIARERDRFRSYASGRGKWKHGLRTTGEDVPGIGQLSRSALPIFMGNLGELAGGNYLGLSADFELRKKGDGGIDLAVKDLTIQIKTRRGRQRLRSLVRRVNASKTILPIDPLAFLFCRWDGTHDVFLLGWQWTQVLRETVSIEKSPIADHWNWYVPDSLLLPPNSLKEEVSLRR